METTYFNIKAKRLTACGADAAEKASGGPETVYFACPTPRHTEEQKARRGANKVIHLEEYRRKSVGGGAKLPAEEREEKRKSGRGWSKLALALDALATAGILLLVVGVLMRIFLR